MKKTIVQQANKQGIVDQHGCGVRRWRSLIASPIEIMPSNSDHYWSIHRKLPTSSKNTIDCILIFYEHVSLSLNGNKYNISINNIHKLLLSKTSNYVAYKINPLTENLKWQ